MPWTAKNATEHTKRANTPKKTRQWSAVANSMLKSGKSEGAAIRAANAAVGDEFWNDGVFLREAFIDAHPQMRRVLDVGWTEEAREAARSARSKGGGANSYINSLRSSAKRNYATAYHSWIKGGQKGAQPDHKSFGLGTMGAQAVRLELHSRTGSADTALTDIGWTEAAREAARAARAAGRGLKHLASQKDLPFKVIRRDPYSGKQSILGSHTTYSEAIVAARNDPDATHVMQTHEVRSSTSAEVAAAEHSSKLGGTIGGAVGGFLLGGPVGAVIGAGAGRSTMFRKPARAETISMPLDVPRVWPKNPPEEPEEKPKASPPEPSGRPPGRYDWPDSAEGMTTMKLCPICNGKSTKDAVCPLCNGVGAVDDPVAQLFEESETHHESGSPQEDNYEQSDLVAETQMGDREFSTKQRKKAAEEGAAMPGGGFPIRNKKDLSNARQALGRAKNRGATIRHIKKRAKALGVELPEGWPNNASDSADMIDPTIPMLTTPLPISEPIVSISDATPETPGTPGTTSLRMYDSIELDDAAKVRITKDGYLTAMPRIARTGIQLYKGRECGLRDGPDCDKVVRVYRPMDSVFAKDATHTYTHLPVTLEHPPTAVDSANWKKYAVGETADEVLRDGQSVRVPMMLRDSEAIKAFQDGKNQLSVGYDCDIEWAPGLTDDGEEYDAVQRNIRANHLAVVAAARGGPTLAIGDDNISAEGDHTMTLKTLTIDGLEVQMTDQAAAVVQKTMRSLADQVENLKKWKKSKEDEDEDRDDEDSKKDAALAQMDTAVKNAAKTIEAKDGEIAGLKKQLADAQAELSPEKLDNRVKDRLAIAQKAKGILGDKIVCDGKTDAEIRRAVVVAKVGDGAKDWSDEKIAGCFEGFAATKPNEFARSAQNPQRETIDQAVAAFAPKAGPMTGRPGFGYHQMDARDAAYAEYDQDKQNAWRSGKH